MNTSKDAKGMENTGLDNIDTNVTDTHINQLPNKIRWRVMNINDSKSVLGSQSRSNSHSMAPMSCDHFLICLQTPGKSLSARAIFEGGIVRRGQGGLKRTTHAPPEQSDPAITRTLPFTIFKRSKEIKAI
jgi:hypothetical protein